MISTTNIANYMEPKRQLEKGKMLAQIQIWPDVYITRGWASIEDFCFLAKSFRKGVVGL